jgi:hypothetical protein
VYKCTAMQPEEEAWGWSVVEAPQQVGGDDCGIFMAAYMYLLHAGLPLAHVSLWACMTRGGVGGFGVWQ